MFNHNDRNSEKNGDTTLEKLQLQRDEEQIALLPHLVHGTMRIHELASSGSRYEAGCCLVDPITNEIHVTTSPYFDLSYRAYYLDRGEVRLGREYIHQGENTSEIKLFHHSGLPVIILSEKASNTAWYKKFDSDSGPSYSCTRSGYQSSSLSILCQPNELFHDEFYLTKEIGITSVHEVFLNELLEQFGLRFEKSYLGQRLEERFRLIRLTNGDVI
jgi:hypothetical protein